MIKRSIRGYLHVLGAATVASWFIAAGAASASGLQYTQPAPAIIPTDELDFDASGLVETYQPAGPTLTRTNAFFQNLGTNGRTCFSCHQPQQGWTVSALGVQTRFLLTLGTDPIFRPV